VRQGPSREERAEAALRASPKKSPAKKQEEMAPQLEAPKMELPKLSLGFGDGQCARECASPARAEVDDGWLV